MISSAVQHVPWTLDFLHSARMARAIDGRKKERKKEREAERKRAKEITRKVVLLQRWRSYPSG